MQMSALLTKMALFVIVILIGMFGARKKILTKDFNRGLSWLIVNVFIVAAIIIAARSASAFAAEIGTMVVNDEIAAMRTMGIDPVRHLALPRIAAGALALPILSLFADLAGLVGGYITLALFGYSARIFLTNAFAFCSAGDLATTLAKGVVFGVLISATGCRCGLETGAGSDAVGKATTSAVVTSLVLFVAADGLFAPIRAHMQEQLRACLSEFRIRFGTRPGRNVPSPADASLVESLVLGLNGTPRGYGTCPFGKAATPVVLDAVGGLRAAAAAAWFAEFSSPQFLMGDELDAPLYEMLSDTSNIARAKALLQDVILRDSPLADYCRKESLVSKLWE